MVWVSVASVTRQLLASTASYSILVTVTVNMSLRSSNKTGRACGFQSFQCSQSCGTVLARISNRIIIIRTFPCFIAVHSGKFKFRKAAFFEMAEHALLHMCRLQQYLSFVRFISKLLRRFKPTFHIVFHPFKLQEKKVDRWTAGQH